MKKSLLKWTGLIMVLMPTLLAAQGAQAGSPTSAWMAQHVILIIGAAVILLAMGYLWRALNMVMQQKKEEILRAQGVDVEALRKVKTESWIEKKMKGLSGLKPMEQEKSIELDHDYDGIRELDNSLPPWWLYLFYATIAWAVVYMYIYEFSDIGASQEESYYAEMAIADEKMADYLFKQANLIDENNVELITDPAILAETKSLYMANCMACHGTMGEGTIGPNFTDKYWIHGGNVSDIFKTIKYGVPEKGMISWKSQLSPSAMQKLSSYIVALQGTNPPNQKAPEGELYEPDAE